MLRSARAMLLLLLGSLLTGLGFVALLPPFEGFDETGHYSAIAQFAETGRAAKPGDKMAKAVDDYLERAPAADSMQGSWRYHAFFAAGPDTIAAGRRAIAAPASPWSP